MPQSEKKPQFVKQWPVLEPASARWEKSLEHVLHQNNFFLSHLSMLHLLARNSVFLELCALNTAQEQGGKVEVALRESPHFSCALPEETNSRVIFSS